MIGHLLGAAGAVEAVATVQALQTGDELAQVPFRRLVRFQQLGSQSYSAPNDVMQNTAAV